MQWVLQIHYTVNVRVLCETWEWRLPFWEDCVRSSIRNPTSLEQKHGWVMTFKSGGKMPFIVSSAKYWWSLTLPRSRRLKQPQTSSQTFPAMTVLMCPSDPRLRRVKGGSSILEIHLTVLRDRFPVPNAGCKPELVTLSSFMDISSALFLSWWVRHFLHTCPGCSVWTQVIFSPRCGWYRACAPWHLSCPHAWRALDMM